MEISNKTANRMLGIFYLVFSLILLYIAITTTKGLVFNILSLIAFIFFVLIGFGYIFLNKIGIFLKKRKGLHNTINWITLILGIIAIGLLIWRIIVITFFE
jgi:hypothetical protein